MNLGDRIQNLRFTSGGAPIASQRTGPAEFNTASSATTFAYEVNLRVPANPHDGTHISWCDEQRGYLMLGDLLPDFPAGKMQVELSLPPGWQAASSTTRNLRGWYEVTDKATVVFLIGRDLKQKQKRIGSVDFTFVTAGVWSLSSASVINNATRIIKDRSKYTGFEPRGPVTVMLAPFPVNARGWSAETRGNNVVMLANNAAFSSAQLSVVLCHELFHLWIPNALSLTGDYAWFYEGFTLYQALCTAVRLGLVDFHEYLATLGRVYDSYRQASEGHNQSLLAVSEHRWTSGGSFVYDQGMLVAFLCDLKLRREVRDGLDVVYRKLLRDFSNSSEQVDGNEAIIRLLTAQTSDERFVRHYLEGTGQIDLDTALRDYGLRVVNSGGQSLLEIIDPLSNEQRELLTGLGYRKGRR